MKTLLKSMTSVFVTSLLLSAAAQAQSVPSNPIRIKKISYNGSGCPLGTVGQNIASTKDSFTLTFSEFVAETAPGLPPSAARRNCVLNLVLDVPAGWQYSVGTFYYRGFMDLDRGIRAEQSASYFFEGQGRTGRFSTQKAGPYAADYVYSDRVALSSAVWSPCGVERSLSINTSVRVDNTDRRTYPNAEGYITTDSIDGQITQIWGLTWRRCGS
jgi:hypothetical protein